MGMLKKRGPAVRHVKRDKTEVYDIDLNGSDAGKRMSRSEQNMLVNLYGVAIILQAIIENSSVNERMNGIDGGWKRLRTAHTNIHNLIVDIFKTIPKDQGEHLKNQMSATTFFSYVGKRNPLSFANDMGRWLSMHELDMVAQICREQCKFCQLDDPQEQRGCIVNKVMRLMPVDSIANAGACEWFDALGATYND